MSKKIYRAKDRLLLAILGIHAVILFPLAIITTHVELLIAILAAIGLPVLIYFWQSGTYLSRAVIGAGLMTFSAIIIHISGGLIEMHFHVFVGLALLSIYYDWRVIVSTAVLVSLHHLLALFYPGIYNVYAPNPDLTIYTWHVMFVGLLSAVLCYQCIIISRSVNTISQSSRILLEHDLPQMFEYLKQISDGELGSQIEFQATSVPVIALDELGDLSRLFNQIINSLQTISTTTGIMGQGLRSMLNRSYENIAHIRNLYTRMAYSAGNTNYNFPDASGDNMFQDSSAGNLRDQIEAVSIQMVLAAVRMDEMQHALEAKILEQNRLNEQLEKLNERKGELFSTLSHELRTPLTSILGFSELLALRTLPTEEKMWAEQIIQNAVEMRQLINDILEFSKIEAGKINIYPERTGISDAFARLRDEVNNFLPKRDVNIEYELTENPIVLADSMRLHQILVNLLINAIKYTPDGGHISIRAERLILTINNHWQRPDGTCREWGNIYPKLEIEPGEWIAIQVQDNGIGIPAENLPSVFAEFEKIEHRIRNGSSGAGLGLALAKKITNLMGGQIVVESEINQGATFTILLPAWQAASEIETPANPSSSSKYVLS